MSEKKPTWESTKEPNLLRNQPSGRYYARFFLGNKPKWINLDTDVYNTAKLRIADERKKIEQLRQMGADVKSGGANMKAIVALYRHRIEDRAGIQPVTRRRLFEEVDAIIKTWPGFEDQDPRKITRDAVATWRNKIRREGTGHRPPGSKTERPKNNGSSPSLINKCIDALRNMLEIAVEKGQLMGNPLYVKGLKLKTKARKPNLPEAARLEEIFANIAQGGGRFSQAAADFCRGLTYTGRRKEEAAEMIWEDLNLAKGVQRVRGTKTEAADREIPLIPSARKLFERLYQEAEKASTVLKDGAPWVDPKSKVFAVGEAQHSLTRACAELNIERLTHHDLRDAFATVAIEAGVDVPTVAGWLGHADNGALLMRTYFHHRRAHSIAQAAKVTF